MTPACAIVVTLPVIDASTPRVLEQIAGAGRPMVAVPYATSDAGALRALCAPLAIPVVGAPAGASFGGAANAGAAAAIGDAIAFIDGAQPLAGDWMDPLLDALSVSGGGVAGPRVVGPDGSEGCGSILVPAPLTLSGFDLVPRTNAGHLVDVDCISREFLITARSTFAELGGFVTEFGGDWACVDYCLRVLETGRRVVVEPRAAFARLVAPPGTSAGHAFAERWRERAEPRDNFWPETADGIVRRTFHSTGILIERVPIPAYTVIVHGTSAPAAGFAARITGSRLRPADVLWAVPGEVPPGARRCDDAVVAARALLEVRGPDCVAFVRGDTELSTDWLNELVNVLERAPDTVAATLAAPGTGPMPETADARCTLVAPRLVPQHLRIENAATCDAAVAEWLGGCVAAGRNIGRPGRSSTVAGAAGVAIEACRPAAPSAGEPFASIVMLSWNAPDYTEAAVASIRSHTGVAHEIVIVDNGSRPETLARLQRIPDIRLIANAVNTGFAFACNQGLAAGRGTHLVLLNNDVIVTDGWLEALIAVQRTNPTVGCSAPRTNRIAGAQQIADVSYGDDLAGLPAFAAQRAATLRGQWTRAFRVVGFCMCLDRRVVEEIGGLDPGYGTGNFEDDDYSMRIRAAGYDIAVCEDAFIHHFGSVSFRTNNVDYEATFARNKARFARHWDVTYDGDSYDARHPFKRGFQRARDFVPLPEPAGVGADWIRPA